MSHEISPAIKSGTSRVCEVVVCAGGNSSLACVCAYACACTRVGCGPRCALQPGRSAYQLKPDARVLSSSPTGLERTEPGRKRK